MINYQNTKEVAVEGDKNTQVNTELLPILKAIFLNQVKIKDSMKGMWLTYILPRTATRADVETVQKNMKNSDIKSTNLSTETCGFQKSDLLFT